MRVINRWWGQVVFFLLAVVPGIVLMGLDEQWPLFAISVVGACGLLGLIVVDHCERQKLEREHKTLRHDNREAKRERQELKERLDDQGQQASHQAEWAVGQLTGSPEPLDAKTTGMAAYPRVIVHDCLVSLATQSLRQRIYWWLVAKSGWLPPWHRG